jgi:soluble lytic murein transglycosylase-like protein
MYEWIITNCARTYKLDEKLIRAIIKKESSWKVYAFRREPKFWVNYGVNIKRFFLTTPEKDEVWLSSPDIVSSSYGLMQIMLSTAMERGFRFEFPFELFEPATNIKWGCSHLRYLHNKYGDWNDVIAAYNQGNNRKRLDGKYNNQEAYVDIVLQFIKEI